jgi:hypothetical protein
LNGVFKLTLGLSDQFSGNKALNFQNNETFLMFFASYIIEVFAMNKKVKTLLIALCCCISVAGASYVALAQSNDTAVSSTVNSQTNFNIPPEVKVHRDAKMDSLQKKQGIYFEHPKDEKTQITSEAAIEIAKNHVPELAKKATGVTSEFLLYSNIPGGIEQRPVWVVTLEGVSVERRGPRDSSNQPLPLPPVVETMIFVDGNTGDVVSLISMGHK